MARRKKKDTLFSLRNPFPWVCPLLRCGECLFLPCLSTLLLFFQRRFRLRGLEEEEEEEEATRAWTGEDAEEEEGISRKCLWMRNSHRDGEEGKIGSTANCKFSTYALSSSICLVFPFPAVSLGHAQRALQPTPPPPPRSHIPPMPPPQIKASLFVSSPLFSAHAPPTLKGIPPPSSPPGTFFILLDTGEQSGWMTGQECAQCTPPRSTKCGSTLPPGPK